MKQPIFLTAVLLCFALFLSWNSAQQESKTNPAASEVKFSETAGKYNQALATALKGQLIDKSGKDISSDRISAKKHLLVYYSAHWCPPCRAFTPKLAKWYDANHEQYEILFVSSDRSEEKMQEYMAEAGMNWIGVKLNSDGHKVLEPFRQGRGIPNLVLISNGKRVIGSYNADRKYTGPATAYNELQKILQAQ